MNVLGKIKAYIGIDGALSDKRNHQLDALKGLAIILVVLGHSVQVNDPDYDNNMLFRIIFSFHMPAFMFLSGFILSAQFGQTLLGYFKKKFIRLLVPFFVWYLIGFIPTYFGQGINVAVYFYELIKSPAHGLWFLWVLFLNSVLLFVILKIVHKRNWLCWENYFVIGAILLSRTASTDFLGLSEVKQYFPYYAAGFFVCKYIDVIKSRRDLIYTLAVIVFPILVLGWKRNEFPTFYPFLLHIFDKGSARLIFSIYKYAVAFSGIAFSSFLLEKIRQTSFYLFLCLLGTLTLDIYACHQYFLLGFGNGPVRYLSAACVSLALSLALTLFLMKRFSITRLLLLGQYRLS